MYNVRSYILQTLDRLSSILRSVLRTHEKYIRYYINYESFDSKAEFIELCHRLLRNYVH